MTRFADPSRCPRCAGPLPLTPPPVCSACGLDLSGPVGAELFSVLTRADELLAQLAAPQPVAATPATPQSPTTPTTPTAATALRSPITPPPPVDARTAPPAASASVPRILLGLGAVCLLVAALVFLAVTWSVMGVGGRTLTLVGLTALVGGAAALCARAGLRAATEALGAVALGLFALDAAGGQSAGWWGLSPAGFLIALGLTLAVVGAASTYAARRSPARGLVVGELAAIAGAAALLAGVLSADAGTLAVRALAGTVLVAVLGVAARRSPWGRLGVAAAGSLVVAGVGWLTLAAAGLERVLDQPTWGSVWSGLACWPTLAAAALALGASLAVGGPLRGSLQGVAAALGVLVVVAPAVDEPRPHLHAVLLGVLALSVATAGLLPRARRLPVAWVMVPTALWLLPMVAELAAMALGRGLDQVARLWADRITTPLPPTPSQLAGDPWQLAAAVALLAAAPVALARPGSAPGRRLPPGGSLAVALATGLGVVGGLLLLPLPAWVPVAALLLVAAALAVVAVRAEALRTVGWLAAALPLLVAQPLSWSAEGLTLLATLAATGATALLSSWYADARVADAAAVALGPFVAGVVWSVGGLAGLEPTTSGLVGVGTVGLLALAAGSLPRRAGTATSWEVGAAAAAVLLPLLVAAATGLDQDLTTWSAVYLTLAGAAASALALLRRDRRRVGWLGALLLAAATWVRLHDLGVSAPEPYTLPTAAGLLAVGLWRLSRHPETSTAATLTPGLLLAVVPSVLWVVADPLTVRAAVVGVACLLLTVAGTQLRWTAPLVVGALGGLVVVLVEAAPYVGSSVPRWALIATAGTVLVGLGITWERRVAEGRAVAAYVRAMR